MLYVASAKKLEQNVAVITSAATDLSASLVVVENLSKKGTIYQDAKKISIARKDFVAPRAMASLYVNPC